MNWQERNNEWNEHVARIVAERLAQAAVFVKFALLNENSFWRRSIFWLVTEPVSFGIFIVYSLWGPALLWWELSPLVWPFQRQSLWVSSDYSFRSVTEFISLFIENYLKRLQHLWWATESVNFGLFNDKYLREKRLSGVNKPIRIKFACYCYRVQNCWIPFPSLCIVSAPLQANQISILFAIRTRFNLYIHNLQLFLVRN